METRFIILACLSFCLMSGCAAKTHLEIPLVWRPSNDFHVADKTTLNGLYPHQYKVQPFIDTREHKNEIARNIEDKKTKIVTTRDDVADWCKSRFESIMKQHGLKVVEDNPSVIIKGDVLQFYVTEDNIYKGIVGVKITAESAAGKVLWQGVTSGKAQRFGRSYEVENYYETLSDAYLDAVNGLLKNPEFRTALEYKE